MPSIDENGLRVIIVGGGIVGLATATSLLRAQEISQNGEESPRQLQPPKLSVLILERHHSLTEFGAGIQIPPNASRVLCNLGLRTAFEKCVVIPLRAQMKRFDGQKVLGTRPLNEGNWAERNYGSPQWVIHRADYQRLLGEAARAAGAEIEFDKRVQAIDAQSGTLTLVDGTSYSADLIIGADGVRSKVRSAIPANREISVHAFKEVSYRGMIPRKVMLSSPLTAPLIEEPSTTLWLGPNLSLVAYPVAKSELYNLVFGVPRPESMPDHALSAPGDLAELRILFSGFDDVVQKILQLMDRTSIWTQSYLPSLPSWTYSTPADGGVNLVLVGDSVHAFPPHLAQGAAAGIEDGATLAECLTRITSKNDLPRVLQAYEQLRRPRCERIAAVVLQNAKYFFLPDGPEQEERDRLYARAGQGVRKSEDRNDTQKSPDEKGVVKPDITKPFPHPAFLMWLYSYDVKSEVVKHFGEV
ncbi:hypothetical protein MMC13_003344 [Lambiella insularis]|nr:hypothetical protein [Lambiella insularis]